VAFLREEGASQPFLRAPAAVIWLIVALVGAHAVRVFGFPHSGTSWFINYGFVPARYSHTYLVTHAVNPGTLFERVLPFVTYMFLHGSFAHVLINCVWLLAFGPIVARRFGTFLFLAFFLVCGVAGAAVHLAWNWGNAAPVIGASAAVSGLMAAAFRMLPLPPQEQERPLVPVFAPRILVWTAIWVVVNVVAGVTGLGTGGEVQLVAWQAHLGGYAAGLLLAGPFDSLAALRSRTAPPLEPRAGDHT
jgi:membrane associated rhomboid family serine protease